jgi:hypothetical protein
MLALTTLATASSKTNSDRVAEVSRITPLKNVRCSMATKDQPDKKMFAKTDKK